jgi:pyroglutamyl-peptidase
MATLPVTSIVSWLRNSGIPAKVSNSASTFLCNQMMYTVLHLIAEKRMNTRAGFLHVPAHPRLAALSGQSEMPSMSVDLMTLAVKTAIEVSLAEIVMLADKSRVDSKA